MTPPVGLEHLFRRTKAIAGIKTCTPSECLWAALGELQKAVASLPEDRHPDLNRCMESLMARCTVEYGCLGCDPCYPVEILNRLLGIHHGD